MAPKFLCINLRRKGKSQLTLAFFLAGALPSMAWSEVSLFLQAQQQGARGLITPKHWNDERVHPGAGRTWNYLAAEGGARWTAGDWAASAFRSRQIYFKGDSNILTLAAEDKRTGSINTSTWGALDVQGELHALEASHLSLSRRWNLPGRSRLELEPQIFKIHSYQRTAVQLAWRDAAGTQTLRGDVRRVGTRSYGFDPNDRPDAGTGWGLNLRASVGHRWGEADLDVRNLLGGLEFSNVHFSNRRYDALATDRKLKARETPALSGRYGQFNSREKLPMFWKIDSRWHAAPGLTVGLIGLDSTHSARAGYAVKIPQGQLSLETVSLENASIKIRWQAMPKLSLAAGLGIDKGGHADWSLLSASWSF